MTEENETFKSVKESAVHGNIYCHCLFEWKTNLLKLGFLWNNKLKLWFIPVKEFTKQIYAKTKQVRFCNHTTVGPLYYYYVHYEKPFIASPFNPKD